MEFNIVHKAKENHKAAQVLYDNQHYDASASRLYYSIFQYIYEILAQREILKAGEIDGKHGIVKDFLKKNVAEENISRENERYFKKVYDLRVRADYYQDKVDKDKLNRCITNAETFKNHILLKNKKLLEIEYVRPW